MHLGSCILILPPDLQGLVFVNEYAVITTLGRGSFGEVKLALNTSDFEVYALKLISKSRRKPRGSSSQCHVAEASVMSEINVMKELSHPNLVSLVEVIGRFPQHLRFCILPNFQQALL